MYRDFYVWLPLPILCFEIGASFRTTVIVTNPFIKHRTNFKTSVIMSNPCILMHGLAIILKNHRCVKFNVWYGIFMCLTQWLSWSSIYQEWNDAASCSKLYVVKTKWHLHFSAHHLSLSSVIFLLQRRR